ncbi:unnamed protein product [Aspergillus oryzae RIB40]|uniref:DNA, SC001 n=1 Tax=Aspergillus oryzae (strain ATCC 42149 / RIB 40) TaxID=510516 RepID=Q2UMX0_ASPOR|nr:unnamed protein product [Aspergillus oryzae RIB40]BAE57095.1 unnamed protein product [Aspergillus oryzae RIB40]
MASGSASSEPKDASLCQEEGSSQEVGDLSASIKNGPRIQSPSTDCLWAVCVFLPVVQSKLDVADKFEVPQLKQKAKDKFETIARTCWEMDDYPIAISEAYQRTHKGDRSSRYPDFRTVLEEVLGFAADLVRHSPGNTGVKKYCCPNCNFNWMLGHSAGNISYRCPKC